MNQQLNDQLDDLTPLTEMILAAEARLRPAIEASLEKDGSLANLDKVTIIIARMVNMRKSLARMKADVARKQKAPQSDTAQPPAEAASVPAREPHAQTDSPIPSPPPNPSLRPQTPHKPHSPNSPPNAIPTPPMAVSPPSRPVAPKPAFSRPAQ